MVRRGGHDFDSRAGATGQEGEGGDLAPGGRCRGAAAGAWLTYPHRVPGAGSLRATWSAVFNPPLGYPAAHFTLRWLEHRRRQTQMLK